jgi:hypothetical protein
MTERLKYRWNCWFYLVVRPVSWDGKKLAGAGKRPCCAKVQSGPTLRRYNLAIYSKRPAILNQIDLHSDRKAKLVLRKCWGFSALIVRISNNYQVFRDRENDKRPQLREAREARNRIMWPEESDCEGMSLPAPAAPRRCPSRCPFSFVVRHLFETPPFILATRPANLW